MATPSCTLDKDNRTRQSQEKAAGPPNEANWFYPASALQTRPFKDVQPIISCTQLRTVSYFVPAPCALASADRQLC
jgi:hypothetical protein